MTVKIIAGTGARLSVKTKDGKTLGNDQIDCIEVIPFFPLPASAGEVIQAAIVSTNRGEVGRHVISVAGKDGKVSTRPMVSLADSAVPLIDKPKPPLAGAAAKQAERAKADKETSSQA